jgi:UDP-N-acetylmuramoyl-L-alanyl-D-glutamate--2,6-diaminopimelate ligase
MIVEGIELSALESRLLERGLLRLTPDEPLPESPRYVGVAFDAAMIRAGDVWVNLHGNTGEARELLRRAENSGAVATLAEFPQPAARVPHLRVMDPRLALSLASALLHGEPARRLAVAGITGTVGKSTTTCMAGRCLSFAGIPHGICSSAAWRIGDEVGQEEELTTADAPELHPSIKFRTAMVLEKSHIVQP